ncbi:accessory gene regulator B family protein [Metasolibacillus meyeri]
MIEAKITNILIKQQVYTRLEQEKIRYGIRIILKEFYKLLLLYSIA